MTMLKGGYNYFIASQIATEILTSGLLYLGLALLGPAYIPGSF
jgi:hypothetical protein